MKNITLQKRFQAEAVCYSKHYFLQKDVSSLTLYSKKDDKLLHSRNVSFYTKKILISEDERYAFVFSGLISPDCALFALPSLHQVNLRLDTHSDEYYVLDAAFGPQGRYLYVLVAIKSEVRESRLVRVDLESMEQTLYFEGEAKPLKSIYYSDCLFSLLMDDDFGNLYFFNQGRVISQVSLRPSKEALLIEKGEVYLLEEPYGFELFSKSGKSIQHCPLFLGKPSASGIVYQEHFLHMTYDEGSNLLFYVSESSDGKKFRLYLFDLDDFSLVKMMEIKKKPTFLKAENGLLYLKTLDGFFVYRIRSQDTN